MSTSNSLASAELEWEITRVLEQSFTPARPPQHRAQSALSTPALSPSAGRRNVVRGSGLRRREIEYLAATPIAGNISHGRSVSVATLSHSREPVEPPMPMRAQSPAAAAAAAPVRPPPSPIVLSARPSRRAVSVTPVRTAALHNVAGAYVAHLHSRHDLLLSNHATAAAPMADRPSSISRRVHRPALEFGRAALDARESASASAAQQLFPKVTASVKSLPSASLARATSTHTVGVPVPVPASARTLPATPIRRPFDGTVSPILAAQPVPAAMLLRHAGADDRGADADDDGKKVAGADGVAALPETVVATAAAVAPLAAAASLLAARGTAAQSGADSSGTGADDKTEAEDETAEAPALDDAIAALRQALFDQRAVRGSIAAAAADSAAADSAVVDNSPLPSSPGLCLPRAPSPLPASPGAVESSVIEGAAARSRGGAVSDVAAAAAEDMHAFGLCEPRSKAILGDDDDATGAAAAVGPSVPLPPPSPPPLPPPQQQQPPPAEGSSEAFDADLEAADLGRRLEGLLLSVSGARHAPRTGNAAAGGSEDDEDATAALLEALAHEVQCSLTPPPPSQTPPQQQQAATASSSAPAAASPFSGSSPSNPLSSRASPPSSSAPPPLTGVSLLLRVVSPVAPAAPAVPAEGDGEASPAVPPSTRYESTAPATPAATPAAAPTQSTAEPAAVPPLPTAPVMAAYAAAARSSITARRAAAASAAVAAAASTSQRFRLPPDVSLAASDAAFHLSQHLQQQQRPRVLNEEEEEEEGSPSRLAPTALPAASAAAASAANEPHRRPEPLQQQRHQSLSEVAAPLLLGAISMGRAVVPSRVGNQPQRRSASADLRARGRRGYAAVVDAASVGATGAEAGATHWRRFRDELTSMFADAEVSPPVFGLIGGGMDEEGAFCAEGYDAASSVVSTVGAADTSSHQRDGARARLSTGPGSQRQRHHSAASMSPSSASSAAASSAVLRHRSVSQPRSRAGPHSQQQQQQLHAVASSIAPFGIGRSAASQHRQQQQRRRPAWNGSSSTRPRSPAHVSLTAAHYRDEAERARVLAATTAAAAGTAGAFARTPRSRSVTPAPAAAAVPRNGTSERRIRHPAPAPSAPRELRDVRRLEHADAASAASVQQWWPGEADQQAAHADSYRRGLFPSALHQHFEGGTDGSDLPWQLPPPDAAIYEDERNGHGDSVEEIAEARSVWGGSAVPVTPTAAQMARADADGEWGRRHAEPAFSQGPIEGLNTPPLATALQAASPHRLISSPLVAAVVHPLQPKPEPSNPPGSSSGRPEYHQQQHPLQMPVVSSRSSASASSFSAATERALAAYRRHRILPPPPPPAAANAGEEAEFDVARSEAPADSQRPSIMNDAAELILQLRAHELQLLAGYTALHHGQQQRQQLQEQQQQQRQQLQEQQQQHRQQQHRGGYQLSREPRGVSHQRGHDAAAAPHEIRRGSIPAEAQKGEEEAERGERERARDGTAPNPSSALQLHSREREGRRGRAHEPPPPALPAPVRLRPVAAFAASAVSSQWQWDPVRGRLVDAAAPRSGNARRRVRDDRELEGAPTGRLGASSLSLNGGEGGLAAVVAGASGRGHHPADVGPLVVLPPRGEYQRHRWRREDAEEEEGEGGVGGGDSPVSFRALSVPQQQRGRSAAAILPPAPAPVSVRDFLLRTRQLA